MFKKIVCGIAMALAVLLFVTISFSLPSGLEVAKATEPTFADPNLRDKNAAGGYADVSSVKIAVPATEEDGEKKTREWLEKCGLQAETITSADVEMDIELARRFAQENKPVLGICRGCQVINVCFGGTLNQHIDGGHRENRNVDVSPDSWLYPFMENEYQTWHYHHQCADKLGEGLIATQWDSNDKVIEALEHRDFPIYGLQWHPEGMGEFGATVAAAFAEKCVQCKNRNWHVRNP